MSLIRYWTCLLPCCVVNVEGGLNLSSLFSAMTCFLGATLRGLGGKAPKMVGLGGREPPRKFQPLSLSFGGQKHQNLVASGTGVISTNDIVSALVP